MMTNLSLSSLYSKLMVQLVDTHANFNQVTVITASFNFRNNFAKPLFIELIIGPLYISINLEQNDIKSANLFSRIF